MATKPSIPDLVNAQRTPGAVVSPGLYPTFRELATGGSTGARVPDMAANASRAFAAHPTQSPPPAPKPSPKGGASPTAQEERQGTIDLARRMAGSPTLADATRILNADARRPR